MLMVLTDPAALLGHLQKFRGISVLLITREKMLYLRHRLVLASFEWNMFARRTRLRFHA